MVLVKGVFDKLISDPRWGLTDWVLLNSIEFVDVADVRFIDIKQQLDVVCFEDAKFLVVYIEHLTTNLNLLRYQLSENGLIWGVPEPAKVFNYTMIELPITNQLKLGKLFGNITGTFNLVAVR